MTSKIRNMDSMESPLAGKQSVLRFLSKRDLLEHEALITLLLTETLNPIDVKSHPTFVLDKARIIQVAQWASAKAATGMLLVEVNPQFKPLRRAQTDLRCLREELSKSSVELLDLLVVEGGAIQSKFFSTLR